MTDARPAGDRLEVEGLVRRAQAGDADAFARLWQSLQPAVVRYLRVLDGPAADDLAAETWLEVVRHLHRFVGTDASFRSWVLSIAHHRHLDYRRRMARQPEVQPVDQYVSMPAEDAADTALEHLATDAVIALIATLPEDQAQAVMLRVVNGLDVATVAHIMERSPGAVRVLTHRGLRKLDRVVGGKALLGGGAS